ncbi:uncharacterized protein YfaP (DUF2135 family) [Sagittula marina]|uniref:Uncharacterized protein YfaP (DUF2135 family) n=1 Tax=Sagittula marina TaxID=943940 RepID=A0A7W6GUN7_9RHOB|nr:hypothetical protein [Sagittula marina]MBB3988007.1 uncharacterized protein YfaP (DUF2135 family) [Sagittula marina]
MIRALSLILVFAFLSPFPASAQQVFDFDASGETVPGEGADGSGAILTLNWNAQVKIGRLLGEPMVSSRFRFDLLGGTVTLPSTTAEGTSRYETYSLVSLPKAAWQIIELYDVKLRLDFRGSSDDFYLITDVGLPGESGEWSFNVPGSPNWDKLFIKGSSQADDPVYLDGARAKQEFSQGLSLVSGYIVEAHLSLFDLHSWYDQLNPDYYIDAYGTAIRQLEDGMRISYGINEQTPKASETIFERTVKDRLEIADFYKRRLEKLLDLPDRFRIGDNHQPYVMAQRQARSILNGAKRTKPALISDQTRLPGGRSAGREEHFFNPTIETPVDGLHTDRSVVELAGNLGDGFPKELHAAVRIKVGEVVQKPRISSNGNFSSSAVLGAGWNHITVVLEEPERGFNEVELAASDVHFNGRPSRLRVTLTWDGNNSDIDLRVTNPKGATASYSQRSAGDLSLDVDNTNGYGPENIRSFSTMPGNYRIAVHNYENGEGVTATLHIFVNERLFRHESHRFTNSKGTWEVDPVWFD